MFENLYLYWEKACKNVCKIVNKYSKYYYSMYSFKNYIDLNIVKTEEFFNNYIKNGLCFWNEEFWCICDSHKNKQDGAFRKSNTISPLMMIMYCFIGEVIFSKCIDTNRNSDIDSFYSGNFKDNNYNYKKYYDRFYKNCNMYKETYKYYIKIDIKSCYESININKLFNKVVDITNMDLKIILLFKQLIKYIGSNVLPQMDFGITSSFLFTEIYILDYDNDLYSFISKQNDLVDNFKIIRYVDDVYIFFNTKNENSDIYVFKNKIVNYSISKLKDIDLNINMQKLRLNETSKLNEDLKNSLYNEIVNNQKFEIIEHFEVIKINNFLNEIYSNSLNGGMDYLKYNECLINNFTIENIIFSADEVFNSLIYSSETDTFFKNKKIISIINNLISLPYEIINIDPKRLVTLILKTKDDNLVKNMLNNLFCRFRTGNWLVSDTIILKQYLLIRNFKHKELLSLLNNVDSNTYNYINNFCINKYMVNTFIEKSINIFNDERIFYLYLFYKTELKDGNILVAYNYFKNFFDIASSSIKKYVKEEKKLHITYDEKDLKKIYCNINDSDLVITTAHKLRNGNPVSHSSSEVLLKTESNLNKEILENITDLNNLIKNELNLII